MKLSSLIVASWCALGVWAWPRRQACPPFTNGSFVVDQYQLYPENADWDTKRCLLYYGVVFNASVAVYDPYKARIVDILSFDGITHNPALHVCTFKMHSLPVHTPREGISPIKTSIGGVAADPYSNLITVVVDAAAAFATRGKDPSGDNWIIKYDPDKKSVVWRLNITAVTGGKYSGFQDIETDSRGNTYIVGTFPGTLLKVDKAGSAVVPWYVPTTIDSTKTGYTGLAAVGDSLLVNDVLTHQLYRFDMTAEKGTPTLVPRTPTNASLTAADAIYLPPRYGGKVLLAAEPGKGVTVLRSKDGSWRSAEQLGVIALNATAAEGGMVPAAVQVGESLFMVIEFFSDKVVNGTTAGSRSRFPMVDITKDVAALLGE